MSTVEAVRQPRWRVATLPLTLCVTTASFGGPPAEPGPVDSNGGAILVQAAEPAIEELLAEGRYAEAEAAARGLLARVEGESGPRSLATAELLDLLVEALWRDGKAAEAETLELAERALSIREESLGPSHPLVADSLVDKSDVLRKRHEFAAAEPPLLRALAIYSAPPGGQHRGVARVHLSLGRLHLQNGQFERSKEHLEKALGLFEIASGPRSLDVADALVSLATVLGYLGDREEAVARDRLALSIREEALGPHHPQVADSLNNLGMTEWDLGEFATAEKLLVRAAAIREKALGPEHPLLGASVCNLAMLDHERGNLDAAGEAFLRCISIFERAAGPAHPDTAIAVANHGIFLSGQAEYSTARTQFERALAIFSKTLGPSHPRVAWMTEALGSALFRLGDLDGAQRNYTRAIRLLEDSEEPLALILGQALQSLSELSLARGRLEEARELAERAVSVWEASYGPTSDKVGKAQLQLGKVLLRQQAYAEAEATLELALGVGEQAFGDDHPDVARALGALGDVRAARGDCAEALRLYRGALLSLENSSGAETPEMGEIALKTARCLARTGSSQDALGAALDAERISRGHLRLILTGLPEHAGLRYAATKPPALAMAYSLLADLAGEPTERVLDALIRSRALVLDEMGRRHRKVLGLDDPETGRLVEQLQAASAKLAFLTFRGPTDDGPVERHRRLLEEARAARDRVDRELAERTPLVQHRQRLQNAGLADIRTSLPPASGLISYVRFERTDWRAAGSDTRPPSPSGPVYLAFVLTPGQRAIAVPLGAAAEIEHRVRGLQELLSREAEAPVWARETSEAEFRAQARLLRRRVWDPIEPHLDNLEQLFVVPDGALHLVNLAALPFGETGYLVERGPRIHYLSTERDLVAGFSHQSGEGLLALGNPNFDGPGPFAALDPAEATRASTFTAGLAGRRTHRGRRSTCASFQTLEFDELVATDRETREVIGLWRRGVRRQASHRRVRPTVTHLSRDNASETAFKTRAPGRQVLHLATHGFFLGGRCATASGAQGGQGGPDGATEAARENPLLLAGLALAGANHRRAAGPGEDDGILTAEEIAALDLRGVEWAVLSACETGLGEVRAGEGVLGLRRAFRIAGVKTLIMSLWEVEDQTTVDWMRLLYERRFVDGLETAEAVHRAGLELLQQRREAGLGTHPFHWAGFVAAGDWR